MASPLEDFLSTVDPPLRPLVRYDVNKTRPLSNLQLNTAQQAILSGKPVFKTSGDYGILHDIVGLPGNFVRDAFSTAQGFLSPWKWVPSIYHAAVTGDSNALLPLIPGYTTVKDITTGNLHDVLTHPAGTALDVLPYLHYGLPKVAKAVYADEAANAIEEGAKPRLRDAGTIGKGPLETVVGDTSPARRAAQILDYRETSRPERIRAAMEAGKPGSLLYNLLPNAVTSPEEGFVGRRLSNIALKGDVVRNMAQGNRAMQNILYDKYLLPLQTAFKDFSAEERKGFVQWWEHYDDKNPTQWTDEVGNIHDVPEKLQNAFGPTQVILKDVEKAAHGELQKIWYNGRQYLYHEGSPVIGAQKVITDLERVYGDTKVAAQVAREEYLKNLNEEVRPKTPLSVSKVEDAGSRATFVDTGEGIVSTEPIKPTYSTIPRKSLRLFKVKDQIETIQGRIDRLYQLKFAVTDRVKALRIEQKINTYEGKLRELQTTHELLSKRELLVNGLGKPGSTNLHVSPEDYHLLEIKGPGETAAAKTYLKRLKAMDETKAALDKARADYTKVLSSNAPATFYPHIQDVVLAKIIDKFKQNHPDFMDGQSTFDFEEAKRALEQHTLGKTPKEAGLMDVREVNALTREVESTWQQMADEGFNPQYMSTVPADRFGSVLDPNMFRSGAVKDEPYAVKARVRDITPSGIKDPVIGLTAPALAMLRKSAVREWYTTYLQPFLKGENDLHNWLDSEITKGEFEPLGPGESIRSRRMAIRKSRWVAFDKKNLNISPELEAVLPPGQLFLPKEIYKTVTNMFGKESELQSLSSANIHGMRVFRTAVMGLSAKHLAHITFGGLAMLLMRGQLEELSPSRIRAAWEMAKHDMPKELSAGVDFYGSKQVLGATLPITEATTLAQKAMSRASSGFGKIQAFEERISNFERSLSYLSELERIAEGKGSPHLSGIENSEVKAAIEAGDITHATELAKRGAIKHANKALIDFDGMLPAERGIIRNIFPFYAFTRHIFKYALTYPIDYPLRASFVYRLGEIVQKDMQNQGLPEQWMRYLTFGPDTEGNVTNVDLRFLNPFRSLPDDATGSGLVNTLNPFLGYALEWAGVNPWTTSAERFPDIRYNPQTGYVETKRKPFSLLGLVSTVVPEAGALGLVTGSQYGETNPSGIANQLSRYAFLPGLPHHDNVNLQRATDTLGQFEVAQTVVTNALKTGDTSELRQYNLVPVPGQSQLIPGKLLARIIDSLPSGKPPREQLGIR